MSEKSKSRFRLAGIVLSLVGTNTYAGVLLFVLTGFAGPILLLEALFWGGFALSLVGFGIIMIFRKKKSYQDYSKKPS